MKRRQAPAPARPRVPEPTLEPEVAPALVERVKQSYDCATDGTSIHGLAAIRSLPASCRPQDPSNDEPARLPEDELDGAPEGALIPRARSAPPAAQPAMPADPRPTAVRGTTDIEAQAPSELHAMGQPSAWPVYQVETPAARMDPMVTQEDAAVTAVLEAVMELLLR